MSPFKPRATREDTDSDWAKVRTGLGKSDRPGSQGGVRKRDLLSEVRAPDLYPDNEDTETTGRGRAL